MSHALLAPQTYIKTAADIKRFGMEIPTIDLATGETISSADWSATPSGGSHITLGSAAISGNKVESLISGGVQDTTYEVTLRVVTSTGQDVRYGGKLLIVDLHP